MTGLKTGKILLILQIEKFIGKLSKDYGQFKEISEKNKQEEGYIKIIQII